MRAIAWGTSLGLALLISISATSLEGSEVWQSDTADTVVAAHGLERLQAGVPVRASYALYGDSLRPVTVVTGKFFAFQTGEAFEMEVPSEEGTRIQQVAIEDLLSIEVGKVRRATTSGTLIGFVSGALLGIASAAIAASETPGDADYGTGVAIGGILGAGVGAVLGYHNTEIEWQKLPLYGAPYDDPPLDPD